MENGARSTQKLANFVMKTLLVESFRLSGGGHVLLRRRGGHTLGREGGGPSYLFWPKCQAGLNRGYAKKVSEHLHGDPTLRTL